ncbi:MULTISPECIES: ABC transporter ATP-binding protein [Rhodococcus]|jgi:branched-chain amino acid transport system ATP-binding protein|uniref:ABC transporter ATP-binding protein n=1 Tax=Rhodococcus qingshengii JCM 15477 TaxID=1303681 RepID=A0AB38RP96_RHOSG|nr:MULTISPECIES: ABC transporter ATP-binding protein [Rhodococcus]ANQ75881.1 high-affinity branched-chain amino acid ABC transporter ATP-binding protein LivG [Rhodococcus sp. 008]KSU69311.1 ABC transporter ATP-binding protein [Rhodococcus qingshengii]MDA3635190.1 ABC transporter ATP-binding protein [Rhodococcus sp. C-2]UPU46464.1 ABC transporter ATP-binding protein [Rhodococcus qingshengii JCM 15477]SCC66762.1 amino acid/amide ABC transporter ATP-binding protein 1, HAAT family (TC 3.A.1.4.-) [
MSGLIIDDVSMHFGGIKALDGLSFTIGSGQICGLIGPNGAGKTTLFNCVSRIYQPSSGSIRMDGEELLSVPAHKIAGHGVARTFQNLGLFPSLTFLENTMAGAYSCGRGGYVRSLLRFGEDKAEKQLRSESFELLERLDLADLAFLPAADQPFGTLKRLELARALAAKPKLLLLDEPAGGLTHSEVDELSSTILRVRDEFDLSILLVEHHMAMVMGISDLVVAMNFGKKIAEGKPTEVRSHPEVISAYLGAPAA